MACTPLHLEGEGEGEGEGEEGGGEVLLKRFAPFSYLNHSFILSLNVKVYIRFIVFLHMPWVKKCYFLRKFCVCTKCMISYYHYSCSLILLPLLSKGNKPTVLPTRKHNNQGEICRKLQKQSSRNVLERKLFLTFLKK